MESISLSFDHMRALTRYAWKCWISVAAMAGEDSRRSSDSAIQSDRVLFRTEIGNPIMEYAEAIGSRR
jgi:hypothetical protein